MSLKNYSTELTFLATERALPSPAKALAVFCLKGYAHQPFDNTT